jgi:hypothetical protein
MLKILGYTCLILALLGWGFVMIRGLIEALPWGLVGLVAIAGFGFLLIKVVSDRLKNKEDDYYDKNVKK